mmetsp:Transcript_6555/g.11714  ORF Transcript_6555/g.11714 Transcript_6555/m.11714 type:complete len:88 (-) Transcript_6555:414-677(-)
MMEFDGFTERIQVLDSSVKEEFQLGFEESELIAFCEYFGEGLEIVDDGMSLDLIDIIDDQKLMSVENSVTELKRNSIVFRESGGENP